MKKTLLSLAPTLGLLALTFSATAQALPGVAARQAHERARIRQGVASGQLTRTEAAHLRAREADIHHDKLLARADGVVTPAERQSIRREEAQASRAIYRQKHDGQVRRR